MSRRALISSLMEFQSIRISNANALTAKVWWASLPSFTMPEVKPTMKRVTKKVPTKTLEKFRKTCYMPKMKFSSMTFNYFKKIIRLTARVKISRNTSQAENWLSSTSSFRYHRNFYMMVPMMVPMMVTASLEPCTTRWKSKMAKFGLPRWHKRRAKAPTRRKRAPFLMREKSFMSYSLIKITLCIRLRYFDWEWCVCNTILISIKPSNESDKSKAWLSNEIPLVSIK
jgi:hypothetical protein